MSVLSRSALESSPLADLHEIASELGLDGFRRMRKADLVATIIERQGGDPGDDDAAEAEPEAAEDKPARRPRSRGGRGRGRTRDRDDDEEEGATDEDAGDDEPAAAPRSRRRGGRDRDRDRDDAPREDKLVEGTVELLPNGSGFVRLAPPGRERSSSGIPLNSDDDVYVSAAQVRRCELVSGDVVAGPVRPPRRSERHPSLVRVDTINGRSADEVAEGTRFDDLPAAWPAERLALGGEDATLKAIEWLTPVGRGSRAVIVGGPRAGKSEALRRLAGALAGVEGLELSLVLAGARPEELTDAKGGPVEPVAALGLTASPDAQAQAVERALDTAKRVAARGGDAVVIIDSLDHLPPHAARRAVSAGRNIADGGSLTVIAAAREPLGGETTVIALDPVLTSTGRFPALDLVASGTLRPELLVGDAGADAIAQARAAALG